MDLKRIFEYIGLSVITSSLVYKIFILMKKYFFSMHEENVCNEIKVYINGMSSSFPSNIYSQKEMLEMFIENYCGGETNLREEDFQFINRVFSAALISTCHINLSKEYLFRRMKREEYTEYIKETILSLSIQAGRNAIKDTEYFQLNQITHLIFGTMTGSIAAPSMDILIAKQLQLNSNVKRLNVESMGCLTGFRLLALSKDIAFQSRDNCVLLIVADIRSALGNQLTEFIPMKSIDKSNVIISALFRDACAATIISQKKRNKKSLNIIDHRSQILPNTFELGRLKEFNDSSIHLYLDKQLPYALFQFIPNFIHNFLHEHQINIDQCQFAVHTGGPKIIRGITNCLNLKDEQLCASWFVMINYGNLSGSSNLVVLEHFRRWKYSSIIPYQENITFPDDFHKYKYLIGLSFGPGIALECVLLELQ